MTTISIVRAMTVAALLVPAGLASADVMTFNNLPNSISNPDYTEGALRLTSTNGNFFFRYQPGWASAGNPVPSIVGSAQFMNYHLAPAGGGTFNFESMDVASYAGTTPYTTTVYGYFPNGSSISREISSAPGFQVWTTITFDSSWNGVSYVEFVSSGFMYDNLVGTVPTPGAAALLGLGGLAVARRRR